MKDALLGNFTNAALTSLMAACHKHNTIMKPTCQVPDFGRILHSTSKPTALYYPRSTVTLEIISLRGNHFSTMPNLKMHGMHLILSEHVPNTWEILG
jgi:hypothetical protein